MKLTTLPYWNKIKQSLSSMRKNIVIDCGHIAIRHNGTNFEFGNSDCISDATLDSFHLGLQLYRHLKSLGSKVKLSVCLSDTSRLLGDGSKRAQLAQLIDNREWNSCLPSDYFQALSESEFNDLVITLQTRNSNRFSALIKKVKTRLQRGTTHKVLFEELNAVFLSSLDGDRFAVSNSVLLNCQEEDSYYGNTAWRKQASILSEENLAEMPFSRLRRIPYINLYEKSSGILCPSTYGGLLLHFDETYDHVCIYSRADDTFIGEKILRGVLATNSLKSDFSRNCLQIIFPEISITPEISLVSSNSLRQARIGYEQFIDELSARRVFEEMTFYQKHTEEESTST